VRRVPPRPVPLDAVETWVFDLDNTLYPAASSLFDQVDRRMGEFVARHLGLPFDAGRAEQKRLFRAHGTTLRGLMVEHGVDPVVFMDHVHAIDLSGIDPDPRLDAALARLPGRKVVYTNGSVAHAARVTAHLGIARHFDATFDIAAAGWVPKPEPAPYATMLDRLAIDPARAAMVEDIARNLVPAAALGMATVWVRSDADWAKAGAAAATHIHHETDDLPAFLLALTGDPGGHGPG
jgi:putative hydrolase of the HAD superfamily